MKSFKNLNSSNLEQIKTYIYKFQINKSSTTNLIKILCLQTFVYMFKNLVKFFVNIIPSDFKIICITKNIEAALFILQ